MKLLLLRTRIDCSVELRLFTFKENNVNSARKKQLRTQAHLLKPVIIVGQSGLTEAVLKEIETTLDTHELIKIKIRADKEERKLIREQITADSKADLIQSIGQIIVIYRKKPEPKKPEKNTGPRRR